MFSYIPVISKKKSYTQNIFDYILIYLLLASNFVIAISILKVYVYSSLIILLLVFKKMKFLKEFYVFIGCLIFVMFFQVITLQYFPIYNYVGFLTKIFFAYLIIIYIGKDYLIKFIKLFYYLTIVGLILWILINVFPQFRELLVDIASIIDFSLDKQTLYVFNIEDATSYGFYRNDGFAYEPGSFSIGLLFAIYFNYLLTNNILNKYGLVFLIGLFSTFSTSAYIVIFLVLIIQSYSKFRKNILKLGIINLLIIVSAFYVYNSADFMKDKIDSQVSLAQDPFSTRGRFASGFAELRRLEINPLWGVGFEEETRYNNPFDNTLDDSEKYSVNGIFYLLSGFGILYFLFYMFFFINSLYKLSRFFNFNAVTPILFFIAFLVVSFSQTCLTWALFYTIFFIPLIYNNSNNKDLNNETFNHNPKL